MEKAASWNDYEYWAAWDKWDEVIDWGDEESLPTTPPTNQASTSTGNMEAGAKLNIISSQHSNVCISELF